jgi:hypothetical protein
MKKKVALVAGAAGALMLLVPVAATANGGVRPSKAQPACIVITGPNGLNIQIGYAPNGPGDCVHLR